MTATVTKQFKGVRDGEHQARTFFPGSVIEGDLADAMVTAGFASRSDAPKKDKARGRAPKDKSK